jgi:carboxypeptidase C (cathepsin A)
VNAVSIPQRTFVLSLTILAQCFAPLLAREDTNKKPGKTEHSVETSKDQLTRTQHTLTLEGKKIEYEAVAGTLVVQEDDAKHKANMFFISYTRNKAEDPTRRPITFAFNGGPGSSSVWLHMGLLGPRRIDLGADGTSLAPPYRLVENEACLLDLTDLVFIDPVTTGYSRAEPADEAKQFHGVAQDLHSVAEFIRLYTTKFGRWDSPKYLAGESYGTTRAAGLSEYLQNQIGMNLNGIILISAVLNFQTLRFDEGNDLPYILFLPTYTATAWYHKKLDSDLQADRRKALEEVEKFALGEYTAALMKGGTLTTEERRQTARKLARYTGLSEEYLRQTNLRIEIQRFIKQLLRDSGRTVGRYDSRFMGRDGDAAGERSGYDPSYAAVQGPYTALLQQYLGKELNYLRDQPYRILTGRVQPWDFGQARNRYLNVSPALRQALTQNPGLRVFVANGYYDLATPYFATQYTVNHLDQGENMRPRVRMTYYDAGHMMYIDKTSLHKLRKDLAEFYQARPAVRPAAR